MKPGTMTLTDFGAEIERRSRAQRDILAPARKLEIVHDNRLAIVGRDDDYGMNRTFQTQLASYLGYPLQFWDRTMAEHPAQWQNLVDAMLQNSSERRMIRTLDGTGRAFLSDKYLRISNLTVANVIAKAIGNKPGWRIESAEVTDDKMYLKVMTDRVRDVGLNQPIQAGFIIRNSETGLGSYDVQFLILEQVCLNGMVLDRLGIHRRHLGAALGGASGEIRELYSDRTNKLIDQALMSATTDVIRRAMTGKDFDEVVQQFRALKGQPMTGAVQDVVELASQDYGLTEKEQKSVFSQLVEAQSGANHLALVQAITYTAHESDTYQRAVELEEIGGKVFDLTPTGWKRLNEQKPAKKLDRKAKKAERAA